MIDVKHRRQVLVALDVEGRVLRRLDDVLQVHDCLGDTVEENLARSEVVCSDVVTWLVGLHLPESGDRLLEVPVVDVQEALVEQVGDDQLFDLWVFRRRGRAEQVA